MNNCLHSVRIIFWTLLVTAMAAGVSLPATVASAPSAPRAQTPLPQPVSAALQKILTREAVWAEIRPLYRQRSFQSLWLDDRILNERGQLLFAYLTESWRDGLKPTAYQVDAIQMKLDSGSVQSAAYADLLLSRGLRRYIIDMGGVGHMARVGGKGGNIAEAVAVKDLGAFLYDLAPDVAAYHDLRNAMDRYHAISAKGGWNVISPGPVLKPGQQDGRVIDLQRRLAIEDARLGRPGSSAIYDADLSAAVRRFQIRNGLNPDGVVGAATVSVLNVPAKRRVASLATNMRRLRQHLKSIAPTSLIVNLSAAELLLVENGREVLRSRVIVGRRDWPTPLLKSIIRAVEINPYWTVPPRIAKLELLPKIRRDTNYLARQSMRVFSGWQRHAVELNPYDIDWFSLKKSMPYRLRQDPGPKNPLGQVKFLFPNRHQVYLHDTPNQNLFGFAKRTFSHGCVRVEKAYELASRLLSYNPNWSDDNWASALESGKPLRIRLKRPIPIFIVKLTAWADAEGQVHFRPERPTGNRRYARDVRENSS